MHDPYQQQVQITVHKESWWSVKLAKQTKNKQAYTRTCNAVHCKIKIAVLANCLVTTITSLSFLC